MRIKSKKIMALALCGLMMTSLLGGIAEAHHRHEPPPRQEDSHSEGEVITAGIVGAVVGAIVAKNT